MIRRAVILAAGVSQRLAGLKLKVPKPLIEIAGKPLLSRHLEDCAASGIEEVLINLHHFSEQITAFVGDGAKWGFRVHYNHEPKLLGTAGAVKAFAPLLQQSPFAVIYGDNFCTFSIAEVIRQHLSWRWPADMTLALYRKADGAGSGVASCSPEGRIEHFVEKPGAATGECWANGGMYILEPRLLDLIPAGIQDFGRDVIPRWIAEGKILRGFKSAGTVYPIDTPELLTATTRKFPPADNVKA